MSKRSKAKYPNLVPNLNLKRRQEAIDFDYLHKLSKEEKEWLNQFMGEYLGASFKKDEKLNVSKCNLHKKQQVKEVYDSNNARNRDIYGIKRCLNGLDYMTTIQLDDLREKNLADEINHFEEGMISKMDFEADPDKLKEEILGYMETLKRTKTANQILSERDSYIKYLNEVGFD